jgi:hypothetical protein
MATLEIRKETSKVWKHIPSDDLPYIVSKLYIKSDGDNIRIVEQGGSQRGIFNFANVSVFDIGGSAETFTSVSELMQRLEALNYIGFFYDGEVTPKYKVYTALLTQIGTDAPTAVILENTLGGDIVWVRDIVGNYRAVSNELFTINKTHVMLGIPTNLGGFLGRSSADDDISNLYIYTSLTDGITFSDDVLNVSIEIRVYN